MSMAAAATIPAAAAETPRAAAPLAWAGAVAGGAWIWPSPIWVTTAVALPAETRPAAAARRTIENCIVEEVVG